MYFQWNVQSAVVEIIEGNVKNILYENVYI